jgi:hypothetical protein
MKAEIKCNPAKYKKSHSIEWLFVGVARFELATLAPGRHAITPSKRSGVNIIQKPRNSPGFNFIFQFHSL